MTESITVSVRLHTILQKETPQGMIRRLDVHLPPGRDLVDLLRYLEIDFPKEAMILVVNGRVVEEDYRLEDGDAVSLMPALSGGNL